MWRCVLLEWSMFHAALKFGNRYICKVLEYLAENLRCSLCFSWIRPISKSNVLPLKCEYRFVLVHHHATVVRCCCCCCYCVFFCYFAELNLLPQAMNNFIRDDEPFEPNDCSLLFFFLFLFFLYFATHSSLSKYLSHSFTLPLNISTIIFHLLVLYRVYSLFRNLLLSILLPCAKNSEHHLLTTFPTMVFFVVFRALCNRSLLRHSPTEYIRS